MLKSLNFMFSLINNASISNKGDINIPTNQKCLKVLEVLYNEGLIRGYTYNKYRTNIYIKFTGSFNKPVIKNIQSISINSRPIYVNVKVLSKLAHVNEIFIISTPKGIMTVKKALQHNVGGIVFCKII